MYSAIMNNGEYQDINARTDAQAKHYALLKWTDEEAEELEIEILNEHNETIMSWESWNFE